MLHGLTATQPRPGCAGHCIRTLAVYVEYLFYHYNFHDVADRPFGLPRKFSRNGVRVGLSLWLPLID